MNNEIVETTELTELRKLQLAIFDILIEVDKICAEHDIKYWLDGGTLLGARRHQGFIPWDDDLDICMPRSDYNKFIHVAQSQGLPEQLFLQTTQTDPFYKTKYIPCKVRLNNTFGLEKGIRESGLFDSRSHNGFFIDIFPVDKFSTNQFKRSIFEKRVGMLIKRKMDYEFRLNINERSKKILGFLVSKLFSWQHLENLIVKTSAKTETKQTNFVYGYGMETPFRKNFFTVADVFPLSKITFEGRDFPCPAHVDNVLVELYGKDFMTPPPEHLQHQHYEKLEFCVDSSPKSF